MKKNYFLATFIMLLSITSNSQTANKLNFDGVNDVIAINNITTATFTLEATIKPLSNSPTGITAYNGAGILDSDVGGSANDFIFSILNNKLSFWDGSSNVNLNGNTTIVDGSWHHVAVVREATVGLKLYVDGVLDAQANYNSSTVLNSNPKIYIGSAFVDKRFLNIDFSEVRIWNTARTSTQIAANKSNELVLPQTGLLSYYKFNQGIAGGNNVSETILIDELGLNNGTLNNFSLTGLTSNWLSDATLAISSFNSINSSIQIFPNPSSDFIQIASLNKTENYKIYNVLGTLIKTGSIENQMKINIQTLTNGMYFLKLDSGKAFKFFKE